MSVSRLQVLPHSQKSSGTAIKGVGAQSAQIALRSIISERASVDRIHDFKVTDAAQSGPEFSQHEFDEPLRLRALLLGLLPSRDRAPG